MLEEEQSVNILKSDRIHQVVPEPPTGSFLPWLQDSNTFIDDDSGMEEGFSEMEENDSEIEEDYFETEEDDSEMEEDSVVPTLQPTMNDRAGDNRAVLEAHLERMMEMHGLLAGLLENAERELQTLLATVPSLPQQSNQPQSP